MTTRWFSVVVDTTDPRALGGWWAAALGWTVFYEADDELVLLPPEGQWAEGVPGLVFGGVPDAKQAKNRVHLDLASRSEADQAEIVERLMATGASPTDIGQGAVPWVVLADPEGNEFCVLEPRERHLGPAAVAAVVIDAADPDALAAFWVEATGRTVGYRDDHIVSLRHPDDLLPDLELLRSDDERRGKNRVHLDVAPWPDGDRDAEVARLVALGAAPADVGQGDDVTWVVLTDPEGNEFCVLRPR